MSFVGGAFRKFVGSLGPAQEGGRAARAPVVGGAHRVQPGDRGVAARDRARQARREDHEQLPPRARRGRSVPAGGRAVPRGALARRVQHGRRGARVRLRGGVRGGAVARGGGVPAHRARGRAHALRDAGARGGALGRGGVGRTSGPRAHDARPSGLHRASREVRRVPAEHARGRRLDVGPRGALARRPGGRERYAVPPGGHDALPEGRRGGHGRAAGRRRSRRGGATRRLRSRRARGT